MSADVIDVEQARIAEEAGAVAVMALERVPADIRSSGGVARMSDPKMIMEIKKAVTIPVMAKARIGHFVEAQVLEALEVDYIDESEVRSFVFACSFVCLRIPSIRFALNVISPFSFVSLLSPSLLAFVFLFFFFRRGGRF
jgi:hypothetical protein